MRAFDARHRGEPEEGGAAAVGSSELGRRRGRAAEPSGAWRGGDAQGQREGRGHRGDEGLTVERMVATASLGVAGINADDMVVGGQTRRGTGCPRRLGASPADSFVQEGRGGEAEL
jgi:hypothetical protein